MTEGPTPEPARARARGEGDPSLGELFRQLAQDSSALVRQEIELARGEIGESVRRAATGAGWIAAGAMVALVGLLVLIAALVVGLGALLGSYWLAALVVGLAFVAIGAILALTAARRLRSVSLAPTATLEALQDDRRWVQAEIRQAKRELARPTDRRGAIMDRMDEEPGKAEVHTHIGLGPDQPREDADPLEELSRPARGGAVGRARELAEQARERARGAFDGFEDRTGVLGLAREHPLATAGIAFALGFLVAGTSDSGGRFGKAKQQLRGAIIGAISAAVAQEARSIAEGSGLLAGFFGRDEEDEEPAPRRRPRRG